MRVPSFFGFGHLKTAFLASKAAPYLYAAVPHAASSGTMRRLWSLEHRYGLVGAPAPADYRSLQDRNAGMQPWTSIVGGEPHRFVERCEGGVRFAFVRNPYQRLLSAYRAHIATDTVVGRAFRRIAGRAATEEIGFDLFVALLEAMPEHQRFPAFAPQSDWLLTDDIPYHLIGAIERYDADYAAITARISAPDAADHTVRYGFDAGFSCPTPTRDAILRLYGRDFSVFGYDTDPAAIGRPPHASVERHKSGSLYFKPFWFLVDSRIQLMMGNRSIAVLQIENVIENGEAGQAGRMPALRLDLARIHLEAGSIEAAAALLEPVSRGTERSSLLADIHLRRHAPEDALAALRDGMEHGVQDASYLHELGRLSVMHHDVDPVLHAGRAIVATTPPGSTRNWLLDALVDSLTHANATKFALAVLDELEGVEDGGYDIAGKLAGLNKPRSWLSVQPPASAGSPPRRVVADGELRRLAEETATAMETLRRDLLRKVLETYPHLFDADHYSRRCADLPRSGLSAVEHYIRIGSRRPDGEANRYFNNGFYTHHMARTDMGHLDPLVHYVLDGAPNGIDPGPHFESDRFLRQRPDLQGSTANPLNEFLAQDADSRGYFGALPEHVLTGMKALSLYDRALFPQDWLIGQDTAPPAFLIAAKRQGEVYGRLDRDLPDGFTHLVLVPWVAHPGGADRVSTHVLRLLAEELGPRKVVAIGTDRPGQDGFPLPAGVTILSLMDYDATLTVTERVEIIERLIVERRPKVTFVQNSDVAWTLLAERAERLRSVTALYAFLFGAGFSEDAGPVGFHNRLGKCLDAMTALITDNTRFPGLLPRLLPMLPADAAKIHTIFTPRSTDLDLHAPNPRRRLRRALWMSRFSSEKRMDVLGRIAAATPDREYAVYGAQNPFLPPVDIDFLRELPNVTVHGYFRDLTAVAFQNCDAFVYTSDADGLPLALIEATAMGLPIIAPDVGGISDMITSDTGWLVSGPDAVDEYVAALREIEAKPDLVRLKVSRAQDLLMTRHSWSAFRDAYRRVPGLLPSQHMPAQSTMSPRITAVSLGEDCQSTFQIRRYLKEHVPVPSGWIDTASESAPQGFIPFPLDWLITPLQSLLQAIDSDFSGFLLRDNLEFVDVEPAPYILDKGYGTIFYHFFDRNENFLKDYEIVAAKFEKSLKNWRETLHSGKKIVFVRQTRYSGHGAREIASTIERAFPGLTFVLLVASELIDENSVEGNIVYRSIPLIPGNWQGYNGLWDEALDFCWHLLGENGSRVTAAA